MLNLFRRGDQSSSVVLLQAALNRALGVNTPLDGDFGPTTEGLVLQYQQAHGLTTDGQVGPSMITLLGLDLRPRRLSDADFDRAARRLNVTIPHIKAVCAVESRGAGFLPDGRPVILFERHQYYKKFLTVRNASQTEAALRAQRDQVAAAHPDICHPVRGGYVGGAAEWDRLTLARGFNDGAALDAASWGLFQIMGFNAKGLGYPSVQSFVRAMEASEGDQLEAFCRFVLKDPRLVRALQQRDWATFAMIYNGPAYRDNKYDVKLATAYLRAGGR